MSFLHFCECHSSVFHNLCHLVLMPTIISNCSGKVVVWVSTVPCLGTELHLERMYIKSSV